MEENWVPKRSTNSLFETSNFWKGKTILNLNFHNWPYLLESRLSSTFILLFLQDVTLLSEYGYGERHIDGHLIVDYSLDPDKRLTLRGKINDKSDPSTYNYTGNLIAEHNATNLKLNSFANIFWNPTTFGNNHITKYQRSYLPVSTSETLVKVNLDNNEIELKVNDYEHNSFCTLS